MKNTKNIAFRSGVEYLSSLLGVIEVISLDDPDIKRRLALFWGKKHLEDIPMLCLHAVETVCNPQRYIKTLLWLKKEINGKMSPDNPKHQIFTDVNAVLSELLSKNNIAELKSLLLHDYPSSNADV